MAIWLPSNTAQTLNTAKVQLFCFPHAGGGIAHYHRWGRLLPDSIAILPVNLPGRESRFNEPAIDDVHSLIDRMAPEIIESIREPFALFGHSMGGLIAYELAIRLREHNLTPLVFFVSASRAPHRYVHETGRPKLCESPDDEMIEVLARDYGKGGVLTSGEKQMMQVMANTIRADLRLLETYSPIEREPFSMPIMGLVASDDRKVTLEDVSGWRQHTTGPFKIRTMPGNHFYLRDQEKSLAGLVASTIANYQSPN